MTNFQRDLIRYLETATDGREYDNICEEFFYGEHEYWVGNKYSRYNESTKKYERLDSPEPYDETPESWKAMNVSYQEMDSYGGEGMGDSYWRVVKFTDNTTGEEVFIKFDGWYQSYNGAEYTSCFVVQPKEKTVVVYE